MARQRNPQLSVNPNTSLEFPHGWVQCEKCKTKYCSREVFIITHRPPYEFRCEVCPPGQGLYLRWKIEQHQGS